MPSLESRRSSVTRLAVVAFGRGVPRAGFLAAGTSRDGCAWSCAMDFGLPVVLMGLTRGSCCGAIAWATVHCRVLKEKEIARGRDVEPEVRCVWMYVIYL